jgi:uncharacterized repeat protein (TIGR03803 family)
MTKPRTHRLFTLLSAHSRNVSSLETLSLPAMLCIVVLFCVAAVIAAPAQNAFFTSLYSFCASGYPCPDGETPSTALVQGTDGNLYGTTPGGGAAGYGTVFEITPAGALTTLHSFDRTDGAQPGAALVQGSDGNFYGTTYLGGAAGLGTVFKMSPAGTLTTLHSFCLLNVCTEGAYPCGQLVQGSDGYFYGSAAQFGAYGYGVIFKITPGGVLTVLHSFNNSDGYAPCGGLVQASDGNIYGTTESGGANDGGTVFRITPAGGLTTLHSFGGSDGADPYGAPVQAADGNFYGITIGGGSNNCPDGCGTVYKITPSGTLTTLHLFESTDGATPVGGLVQAADGNFYGTTFRGGAYDYCGGGGGCGTAFKVTPSGTLTTLYSFCLLANCADGGRPEAGLVQASDGNFYGTTSTGGASVYGTVFRMDVVRSCATCRP